MDNTSKAIIFLSLFVIIAITASYAFTEPEPQDESELYSLIGISAEYVPLVYDGINREYPDKMIIFDDDNLILKDVPKLKKILDNALSIDAPIGKDEKLRNGIFIEDDYYFLIQTGPFSIKSQVYLNQQEFNEYKSWAEKYLIFYPIYDEVPRAYVSYNEEIFWLKFDALSLPNCGAGTELRDGVCQVIDMNDPRFSD